VPLLLEEYSLNHSRLLSLIQPLFSQVNNILYALIVVLPVDPTLRKVLLNLCQLATFNDVLVSADSNEPVIDLVERQLSNNYELYARSSQQYYTENILVLD
jgi:hypothetical protein